jgi:hypothetical protein
MEPRVDSSKGDYTIDIGEVLIVCFRCNTQYWALCPEKRAAGGRFRGLGARDLTYNRTCPTCQKQLDIHPHDYSKYGEHEACLTCPNNLKCMTHSLVNSTHEQRVLDGWYRT